MSLWYDIEADWDYGYVSASTDGGATWENLVGTTTAGDPITTTDSPNGQNFGNGFTGSSGGWLDAVFDASAFAGQDVLIQFRYRTDGAVANPGFMVDDIAVGDFTSNAEPGDEAQWTLEGFSQTTGTETVATFNAYVAEYRQYRLNDFFLKPGPYEFTFADLPNYVEHFPYQDGLLVSYWDNYHTDNNTSQHPGEGLILPIDAHPELLVASSGNYERARVQVYDATFTLSKTDKITLNSYDRATGEQFGPKTHPGLPGVSVFDDSDTYWYPEVPGLGVILPDTGTQIRIDRNIGVRMQVTVTSG
jgi:immune inhibitor A